MHSRVNNSEPRDSREPREHRQRAATRREIVKAARDQGVNYIRLVFADILGISKSVVIPTHELERALDGKVTFDGGSIDGFVRDEEVDMALRPDLSTFTIYPWTRDGAVEARLICDVTAPDGEPFEGCPRTTLRRAIEDAGDVLRGLTTGLEVEFYLFELNEQRAPTTSTGDAGSYFDFSATDRGEEARSAIVTALEAMGMSVHAAHHEHGSGQHEIDFREAPILTTADNFFTFRRLAKQVAARFDLHATFMPKPLETSAGSGLHVYFSWPSDDAAGDAKFRIDGALSEEALFAVGGLLEHAPGCTAVCNPTVNSYKRLVAAWDAPIYTVWSYRSANALVRIPSEDGGRRRIEMRSPDASCNPYLALATLVASIAHGVRTHRLPGDPLTGTTYELGDRTRAERGIRTLPKSLRQALDELDRDPIVRGALGDHIFHAFRDAKYAEYERYRRAVHPWEREAYLGLY
jgi:glutamine synthetase